MPVVARSLKNLQVEILADHEFNLLADEPLSSGGDNMGPDPYALLLSSLAACKVMTVQMYARRKGWPVEGVSVSLNYNRTKAREVEEAKSAPNATIDLIEVDISFDGPLDEAQIARLTQISEKCPVHKTLSTETVFRTKAVSAGSIEMV
ncbi:MAG: OsmC family protein [Chloroflexota bacterium]